MKMFGSYHVHTLWSDGKNSVDDYVLEAEKLELKELGISDHLAVQNGQVPPWSMPVHRVSSYIREIESKREAAAKKGITLLLGLEVDFFEKTQKEIEQILSAFSFDYLIGSVHSVDTVDVSLDSSKAFWEKCSIKEQNMVFRKYWDAIKKMAQSGFFSFVGHIDLPKKFGFDPNCDLSDEIEEALDAIAKSKMAIELNTSGWHYPCKEAYPCPTILEKACQKNIPVVLNADAHMSGNLTRDFKKGLNLIVKSGYTHCASYKKKKLYLHPINDKEHL